MTAVNVADSTAERMGILLKAVTPEILGPVGLVWKYYPKALREVDGVAKWTGFLHARARRKGSSVHRQFDELADYDTAKDTVSRKIQVIRQTGAVTSIEQRSPPEYWGGAGACSEGMGCDGEIDGLTGGPELVDHLVTNCAQFHSKRITFEVFDLHRSFKCPGVEEAIDDAKQWGLTYWGYLAMAKRIECCFAGL